MAKYRPIYTKIWSDPDFLDYDLEAKLIFIYLCTNKCTTESGIYAIPLKTIANETGIPLETVRQRLNNGSLRNVHYDFNKQFVFIKNLKVYGTGGRPDLITKAIETEYRESRNTYLWSIFFKTYPEYNNLTILIGEPLDNPLPTVEQPIYNNNHNNNYNIESISKEECLSLNNSIFITNEEQKDLLNANQLRSLNTFKDWQDTLHIAKNKIAFLVQAFKHLHQEAPSEEFENLFGRIGIIVKKAGGDHGFVLKAIWDTSSIEIAGFHLDYIQQKVQKSKKEANKREIKNKIDPDKYTRGKYGHMVQQ